MDSRVFRMTILTIISAFILVMVIVYATNADKINKMFGREKAVTETASEEVSEVISEVNVHGEQIGDNLGAFMYDEDFFDETESIPAVVVIRKTTGDKSDESGEGGQTVAPGEGVEPSEEDRPGSGNVVVGQLENPNPDQSQQAPVDENGYLTSVPEAPPGGFGEYIPSGSVVGNP